MTPRSDAPVQAVSFRKWIRRRLVRRAVIALLLSVSAPLLIAWAVSALRLHSASKGSFGLPGDQFAEPRVISVWDGPGNTSAEMVLHDGVVVAEVSIQKQERASDLTTDDIESLEQWLSAGPAWAFLSWIDPELFAATEYGATSGEVYGWPLPAINRSRMVDSRGAWLPDAPIANHIRWLPLGTLPGAYAINALATLPPIVIATYGPLFLRTGSRLRAKRCPNCRRSRAGIPGACPECGLHSPARRTAG